ncbi:class I SAM-dependent methyltransferase [Corynebacterium lizhenjunii]|uniref:Class I SAM-dependent methyltransferase n=1 Tax=Corynebacterium lizhenjunii TaxID=2709394 RepID=A0A7T0KG34_9CORY|nr:class I SAM-dependent methyltransferase [Corynebacterium lizhenjunii]QPK80153.1 class I SAM-dependent methyltransferase [Corynebacterium lizhenjunii]
MSLPANYPAYRRPSRRQEPRFSTPSQRLAGAAAFEQGADEYDDIRPGYPLEVADLLRGAQRVVDIGAGTGKFTRTVHAPQVLALDPSQQMCRQLRESVDAPVWQATAEATGLADNSVDAATCAQAWHWVDVEAACTELDRIIRPGGHVLLVWNTIDVEAAPWVLRLSRIMHSGDVHARGFVPRIAGPWRGHRELRLQWEHQLTPPQLHSLMHTRAYWLRNGSSVRQRMTQNLDWYLYEHLGHSPDEELAIPYRTDAFLLARE